MMAIVIRLLSMTLLSLILGSQATPAQESYQGRNPSRDALIEQGEYLARAGDCVACHTVDDDRMFAGGLAMQTPIGFGNPEAEQLEPEDIADMRSPH